MISPLFNDSEYQSIRASLDVAESRQQALANNVANVNTPGFQRRDVDPIFQQELQRAMQAGDTKTLNELEAKTTIDRETPSFRLDGNNVNLEREMVEIAKNSAQQQVSAALLTKRYQMLRLAITGKA